MTDEVGALVLRNNYAQNVAIANALAQSPDMLHAQQRFMRTLVREGHLDRALEFLPTDRQIRERLDAGQGLTGPETAVLLAYTKITVSDALLATSLPDDPYLQRLLHAYFPTALREKFREQIDGHALRREIVTTVLVNDTVNTGGTSFLHRLREETGASLEEIVRAQTAARAIFESSEVWDAVEALDNVVAADVQTRIRLHSRRLVERGTRWLLNNRPQPLQLAETIDFFSEGVEQVWSELPKLLRGADLEWYQQIYDELSGAGVPDELATRVAGFSSAFPTLDIVAVADRTGKDPMDVAEVYYDLADRLGITQLMDRIIELPARRPLAVHGPRLHPRGPVRGPRGARSPTSSPSATAPPLPSSASRPGRRRTRRSSAGPARLWRRSGLGRVRPGESVGGDADDADAAADAFVAVRVPLESVARGRPRP